MSPIRLRVRELREAKGWSQRELAKASGLRQATISQIEASESASLAEIEKLADALGVNAIALIVHEPQKKRR